MQKDEIKEILGFDFQSQGERIEINEYERNILKDYITNLQEENERLKKENIKLYKKDTKIINELKEELKITQEKWDKDKQFSKCRTMEMLDYKSRNKKAIEYIKHEWFKREQIGISHLSFSYDELQKILDILNGDDE